MAGTYTLIGTTLDVDNVPILNLRIEKVTELPEPAHEGRVVYFEGFLWSYDGKEWQRVAKLVTEWSEEPTDDTVPSAKLVFGTFEAVGNEIDELDTRLTDAEGDIGNLHGDVTRLGQNVTDLKGDVTARRTDVGNLGQDISSIRTDVGNLKSDIQGNDADIENLKGDIARQGSEISGLESRVTVNETEIDSLHDETEAIHQDISGIRNDIGGIETRLTTAEADIDDLETRASEHEQSIETLEQEVAKRTPMTMAIPQWDETLEYPQWASVIREGFIYIAQEPSTGIDPLEDDGTHWQLAVGSGGGNSVVRVIGDGVSSTYYVQHNFRTYNLMAVFRTTDEERRFIDAKYSAYSLSQIKVEFSEPIAPSSVAVIVYTIGKHVEPEYPDAGGMEYIQEAPSEEWHIHHTFNSLCFVQVYTNEGDTVEGTVHQDLDTLNDITISFNRATSGVATIVVPKEECVFEHPTEDTTWTLVHNQGRMVGVQAYDNLGNLMDGDTHQDVQTMNSVDVRFNVPRSGYAIVL